MEYFMIFAVVSLLLMISFSASYRLSRGLSARGDILRCSAYIPHSPKTVISSTTNEKVKLVKSLQLKKKRDELNLILLEGFRIIADSISAGHTADIIMCTEDAAGSPSGQALVNQLENQAQGHKLHLISDSVFKSLTETVNGQGVIAAFHKPKHSYKGLYTNSTLSAPSPAPAPPLILLLDGLSDPGNMGTIVRSAYGLGAQCVICVNTCDAFAPKCVRASMSACMTLPIYAFRNYSELDGLLEEIRTEYVTKFSKPMKHFQVLLADTSSPTYTPCASIDYTVPTVLVIGNEANGISLECKQRFKHGVYTRIPMYRPLESFNAAVATSIILAFAAEQRYAIK